MLYDIFYDYFKYCKNSIEEKLDDELPDQLIDINAMMHFYATYFDYTKEDLGTLINEFQKYHIQRGMDYYNYLDFIFTMLTLLNNLQTYKTNIDVITEIDTIKVIRNKKIKEYTFRSLYKDENVYLEFMKDFNYIDQLFNETGKRELKFGKYYEILHSDFLTLLNTKVCQKSKELEKESTRLMKEVNTKENVNFFDFLERLLKISFNYDVIRNKQDEENLDDSNKLENLIQKMKEVPEKEVLKVKGGEKGDKGDKKDEKVDKR